MPAQFGHAGFLLMPCGDVYADMCYTCFTIVHVSHVYQLFLCQLYIGHVSPTLCDVICKFFASQPMNSQSLNSLRSLNTTAYLRIAFFICVCKDVVLHIENTIHQLFLGQTCDA